MTLPTCRRYKLEIASEKTCNGCWFAFRLTCLLLQLLERPNNSYLLPMQMEKPWHPCCRICLSRARENSCRLLFCLHYEQDIFKPPASRRMEERAYHCSAFAFDTDSRILDIRVVFISSFFICFYCWYRQTRRRLKNFRVSGKPKTRLIPACWRKWVIVLIDA